MAQTALERKSFHFIVHFECCEKRHIETEQEEGAPVFIHIKIIMRLSISFFTSQHRKRKQESFKAFFIKRQNSFSELEI